MSFNPRRTNDSTSSRNGAGWTVSASGADELIEVVLVGGQPEEPVLLDDPLERGAVLRTTPVDGVGRFVELLAADAVVAGVLPLVEVPVGGARQPQPLDGGTVARVGARADEVVEREVERAGERLEPGGVGVDELRRRDARRLGGEHVLQRVVVGAAEEADVVAGEPAGAGEHVGLHQLVGVAEVRGGVDVRDGDGDVGGGHGS